MREMGGDRESEREREREREKEEEEEEKVGYYDLVERILV